MDNSKWVYLGTAAVTGGSDPAQTVRCRLRGRTLYVQYGGMPRVLDTRLWPDGSVWDPSAATVWPSLLDWANAQPWDWALLAGYPPGRYGDVTVA